MAYLDVLTLAETKNYLRVDEDLTDDDVRITSFIKTALSYIERQTNIITYARSKDYFFSNYCVYVYDYPINSITTPTTAGQTEKESYSIFTTENSDDKKLTLNVGYSDPADVPTDIKDCALEYIKYLYYDAETNTGTAQKIPPYIDGMIFSLKRFII